LFLSVHILNAALVMILATSFGFYLVDVIAVAVEDVFCVFNNVLLHLTHSVPLYLTLN
jgi:hypothetical protein